MLTRRSALIVPVAAIAGSAANSTLKVGLLGSGGRGTYVADLMTKNAAARVTALCDIVPERMERAKKVLNAPDAFSTPDLHKLLASDIDAVIIATPAFLHADHLEAAVKSGKHIYIEKPAAVYVAGCKRIMRIADSADRKLNLTFGFQRRYGQLYKKAKQAADSGTIGRIRFAHAHFIKSGGAAANVKPAPKPTTDREKAMSWYAWKELSGDLIVENNVHSIDVLNWFLNGHPQSAVGSGGATVPKAGNTRDHNFVAFEYADNVQAQLSGTTLAPRNYRHVVEQFFGEAGMIETSEDHWRHFDPGNKDATEKAPREITIDAVTEFVKRVVEGRPENTGARAAESTLTAILGRMAMDMRRQVTWEEMMKS